MTNTKICAFLGVVVTLGAVCSAGVLLNDTFSDGSRLETNLPTESALWASSPADVTVSPGSVQQAMSTSSRRLYTYFAPEGAPASLAVGDRLVGTITFSPKGALYSSTSRNFRFGLFYDTVQHAQDNVGDSGVSNSWQDATGYAVQFSLSSGTGSTIQLGKRTDFSVTSLLGTGGAYTWITGDAVNNLTLDTVYTMTMALDYKAADQMEVTFTFAEGETVLATVPLVDDGLGGKPINTDFDFLLFRFSQATGCADIVDIHSVKIEHIPGEEPPYEGPPVGTAYTFSAIESCRAEKGYPDTNRQDSSKLTVRGDSSSAKSWIKFNLGAFEPNDIDMKAALLSVTLIEKRNGTVDVSGVNDDCLDNLNWASGGLTWNNAPANDPASDGGLNGGKATFVGTMSIVLNQNDQIGQTHSINVRDIIAADTDGIVQFVLHNSSSLINFGTHNHSIVDYRPVLTIIEAPAGADYPRPYQDQLVTTNLPALSWTNPEPNDPGYSIFCDVYLGTEPNRPQMDKLSLGADVSSAAINAGNFPTFGVLQNRTTYYWTVDCYDASPGAGLIAGMMWTFSIDDNDAPIVDAGDDQTVWLGMSGTAGEETVTLNGVTSDDDLPAPPGAYTVLWEQVANDAPSVVIANTDQDVATVTFTERGTYLFRLTANDSEKQSSDTVTIYVGKDSCDASHLSADVPYNPGDVNEDCIVDLEDFAILFFESWLTCSDTLTDCGL